MVGWACSGRFRDRAAYATSVELSVYLDPAAHGKGLGRKLYETLIPVLQRVRISIASTVVSLCQMISRCGVASRLRLPPRRRPARGGSQIRSILGRRALREGARRWLLTRHVSTPCGIAVMLSLHALVERPRNGEDVISTLFATTENDDHAYQADQDQDRVPVPARALGDRGFVFGHGLP